MSTYENIRNANIGTVEFVSPSEIKVLLDTEAPFSTSLNTGSPHLFPRVNGFLLIPNEAGAIIGMITWIGIEYSPYPKRKGYKDFDIIDLPYPLRKLSLAPLGILKETGSGYEVERGISVFPSVGDIVTLPTKEQLQSIIQNKDPNARIKIGTSPLAANAPVYVDPDKLFGRHVAILGNTGSGKSCTVAGLIRWCLEFAKNELQNISNATSKQVNARFIVLDPNGEYNNCFDGLGNIRKYAVKIKDEEGIEQLKVPSWMWNSWEWASIAQASARTQRPLLRRALREVKNASNDDYHNDDKKGMLRRYYSSVYLEIKNDLSKGINAYKGRPGKNDFGKKLKSLITDVEHQIGEFAELKSDLETLIKDTFVRIETSKYKSFQNEKNETIEYYEDFEEKNLKDILNALNKFLEKVGGLITYQGPDEDSPVFFKNDDFLSHLERLAQEANQQQYLDFFIMRVRSLFTDARIASVINTQTAEELTLEQWLSNYIGDNKSNPSLTILDLSLLPSEILYLIVAVFARIVFEAHHRYKKINGNVLPTVLVVDEAHNLIKRYETADDNISSQQLCTQIFEKIAKEGRKFGLGLVLASQRPSELSQTVLSQCNTFILHRIVSDRDQEMVKKLVPDVMGKMLNELSILPSRKAIVLGWAIPIPTMVEINELPENHRPKSKDPEYWDVWTGKSERKIKWGEITKEWQERKNEGDI